MMEEKSLLWQYGADILTAPGMDAERRIMQHGQTSCFAHSVAVAYVSLLLARRLHLHLDERSLVRGALLHDYFLYDWHVPDASHRLHGFRHARRALENARQEFDLNPVEMDVILKHMFPLNLTPPAYRESAVVCCADKICAVLEVAAAFCPLIRVPGSAAAH